MTNRLQPVYDIAALCAAQDIRDAVLCPGSRNAPLVLAFARHPDITCLSISDERSAAFIALGISQQKGRPAVVVSTSGSAVYNFAPAVAEAFFSHTPLLVITADRPTEWIGQQDGQTVFQSGIFGQHVKRSYQLPQEYEHRDNVWAINRMVNEAINTARQHPRGPVHINVPLREPLYPGKETTGYSQDIRVINDPAPDQYVDEKTAADITAEWQNFRRMIILAGQHLPDKMLSRALGEAAGRLHLPLLAEVISNQHGVETVIQNADLFLGAAGNETLTELRPDLLITFGDGVVSKHVKTFFRNYKPKAHWHVQPYGDVADTFQSVTRVIRLEPYTFFRFLTAMPLPPSSTTELQAAYHQRWLTEQARTTVALDQFFYQPTLSQTGPGEAEVVIQLFHHLSTACNVHLANSMSVRYAALAGLKATQHNVRVYANRGTSGIDGCTSTAVGHALSSDIPNLLITGDVAFFYDRNAFWHNYPLTNLRIVLLNNHGGGIFRMIDGPGDVPETGEFLITRQLLTGKKLCEEFGFDYTLIDSRQHLDNALANLMKPSDRPKVLELDTPVETNKNILLSLKRKIKELYER